MYPALPIIQDPQYVIPHSRAEPNQINQRRLLILKTVRPTTSSHRGFHSVRVIKPPLTRRLLLPKVLMYRLLPVGILLCRLVPLALSLLPSSPSALLLYYQLPFLLAQILLATAPLQSRLLQAPIVLSLLAPFPSMALLPCQLPLLMLAWNLLPVPLHILLLVVALTPLFLLTWTLLLRSGSSISSELKIRNSSEELMV